MKLCKALLLVLVLVVAAAPPAAASPLVKTIKIRYRAHNGAARNAWVVLPASYRAGDDPIPLVISPHGRGVSGYANTKIWGSLPAAGDFARHILVDLHAHDGKLLAAVARHHIDVADLLDQHARHRLQHQVAGLEAVRIVECLEMIHVEHDQAQAAFGAGGAKDDRAVL